MLSILGTLRERERDFLVVGEGMGSAFMSMQAVCVKLLSSSPTRTCLSALETKERKSA